MTTLEMKLNLPDSLAQEARKAGLLTSDAIERLLREAVRCRAADELFGAMDKLADANIPPLTMEEIQAEVDAVRAERRARAGRP